MTLLVMLIPNQSLTLKNWDHPRVENTRKVAQQDL